MPTTWTSFLHCLTPLHCGTGTGEGLIDLPIARDAATTHPVAPGSSLKGVLRASVTLPKAAQDALFGPPTDRAHEHAGALRVSDHHLSFFPTPTDQGTFAWLTSPLVLARLLRGGSAKGVAIPKVGDGEALASPAVGKKQVAVGDLLLTRKELDPKLSETLARWIFPDEDWWRARLQSHLVVVADDVFTFLARHRTDVRAHIRIDDATGTVAKGGLWYEESLPAESILCGVLQLQDNGRQDDLPSDWSKRFQATELQLGGNATTGAGRCRLRLVGGAA